MDDKMLLEIIVALTTGVNAWMMINIKAQILQLELRMTNRFFEKKLLESQ